MAGLMFTNKVSNCLFTFKSTKKRGQTYTVDFADRVNIPIVYNTVLDETLDSAKIILSNLRATDYSEYADLGLDVTKAFEVNTLVKITFLDEKNNNQNTSILMYIARDTCRMQCKDNTSRRSYKHVVELVELTKELERLSVDTLTFTNPIPRNYDAKADVEWSYNGRNYFGKESTYTRGWKLDSNSIKMMYKKGETINVNDCASTFAYKGGDAQNHYIQSLSLTITLPSGRSHTLNSQLNMDYYDNGAASNYIDTVYPITFDITGEYKLQFTLTHYNGDVWADTIGTHIINAIVYIAVANANGETVSAYKIDDTINRLLRVTPLRHLNLDEVNNSGFALNDNYNQYIFNASQLAEYSTEESPEFAFTGHTLLEALLQIAGYKGAFPCLTIDENGKKVISFRKMWNDIWLTDADLPTPVDEVTLTSIDQYCTYIESEVQNLIGINNSSVGSVVEPYTNGLKSTRAVSGSEISQDTAIIPTDYNQYLCVKEELGYDNGGTIENYDLTAYMYESGDYAALSDYSASYPSSKAYALEWVQMGQNITGLAHRIKSDAGIAQAFTEPALANIVRAKTGLNYSTGIVKYISSLVDLKNDGKFGFGDLMFRTTYIPVINARIKQYKENFADFHHDGSIKYNQTAELVDSEMYGEHLKELMRKIGNATIQKIYIFDKIDDVPKVGTIVGGYSVYDVSMSIRENKVIATISYVKYAELSKFIGVKNPWKDSDVSIDKCYNRAISYNEFLLFTHDENFASTSATLSRSALSKLLPSGTPHPLTCVQATGINAYNEKCNTVLLPVVSLSVGNSILFHWQYKNNYSAGYQSQPAPDEATSAISGTLYDRAQKAVKYTDDYGRLEAISYYLMPTGPVAEECGLSEDGGISFITDAGTVARHIAHSLPLMPDNIYKAVQVSDGWDSTYTDYYEWEGDKYISVSDLLIQKNSSEALTFDTQFHFVTDITTKTENTDFIIGSGLSNFCPLVGGSASDLAIYGFTERINIFNRHIAITEATKLSSGELSPLLLCAASRQHYTSTCLRQSMKRPPMAHINTKRGHTLERQIQIEAIRLFLAKTE